MCNIKSVLIALACTWLVGFNAMAATVEFHESAPTPGVMDIYNLLGAAQDLDNVGTATADGATNDASTYVAPDRAAQGQTFLTGSDSDTYRMTGFWVQHCGYTDNTDATWYYMPADSELVVRVIDLSDDAEDFVLYTDSYTLTAEEPNILADSTSAVTSSTNGTGTWIHVTFDTPVDLSADTLYGFDMGSPGSAFFELLGIKDTATDGNPYSDGTAYTSGSSGVANTSTTTQAGDRVFIVELASSSQASVLYPQDKATDVEPSPILSWVGGSSATSHDLYFGTDHDEVADGTTPWAEGLSGTTYDLGELELGQTYYWRVDAVDSSKVFPGPVWTFTVEPVSFAIDSNSITATASSYVTTSPPESTIDGSGLDEDDLHGIAADTMWISAQGDEGPVYIEYAFDRVYTLNTLDIWNSNQAYETFLGFGIKEAMIECSTDGNDWTVLFDNVTLNQATGSASTAITTSLDMELVQARYIRITALSNWSQMGTTQYSLSEVRFSYIPTIARLPQPTDGDSDISVNEALSWRSGRFAAEHQVYFSADVNAVTEGSALVGTVVDAAFDLSDQGVLYDETYYWRIDEINETSNSYVGDVWSYSTASHLVIDDMESYSSNNLIFETWSDGYEVDENGSEIGDGDPYVEQAIVFGGSQSMPMYYNNTDGEQAAWVELAVDSEIFTTGGVEQFSVLFMGPRTNSGGDFYVTIGNTTVTSEASITNGVWTQMIVDLSEFGNLNNATSLTLGVAGNGETGVLYIDDVCLYREAPLLAAAQAVEPSDEGLAVHYKMESNLDDSVGSRHGQSSITLFFENSLAEGDMDLGKALSLEGLSDSYVDLNDVMGDLVATLTDSTYTAWVNLNDESDQEWTRVFDFGTGTDNYMFLTPRSSSDGAPEFGIVSPDSVSAAEQDVAGSITLPSGWHHLAVTIEQGDPNGTLTLYVDGVAVDSDETDTLPADLGETTNNWLGRSQWPADGYFDGLLDEVRIYNRALSEGEIRWLAGDQ